MARRRRSRSAPHTRPSPAELTPSQLGRFRKAMEQLIDARFVSDIHAGNVLFDPRTGTPIVIDPICITPRYQQDFYA
ncbi:hypothetical protein NKI38_04590 [Mesorhizobium sp. M0621]|uniref:hypothetical protein n=1 Tax=Mesorhizobium sp. M0621 TaxID=2956974 RepID=UPI00333D13B5